METVLPVRDLTKTWKGGTDGLVISVGIGSSVSLCLGEVCLEHVWGLQMRLCLGGESFDEFRGA